VVYNAQRLVGKPKDNFWKLRAIESFDLLIVESSDRRMSTEELSKVIEKLIVQDDLKQILLDRNQTGVPPFGMLSIENLIDVVR
jgi:hypothetical protein